MSQRGEVQGTGLGSEHMCPDSALPLTCRVTFAKSLPPLRLQQFHLLNGRVGPNGFQSLVPSSRILF